MADLIANSIETWTIHNRINLYMLDAVTPEALSTNALKGRNAGEAFAHMHNVRLMWLDAAAPDLIGALTKIGKDTPIDKPLLHTSLEASGTAIAALLERGFASGKIKNFKPHPSAFLGYIISHESYHRGEIGIILTQAGHPLDKKVAFGLWEWGVR